MDGGVVKKVKQARPLNSDLWARLLDVTSRHDDYNFWVRGHAIDIQTTNDVMNWPMKRANSKELSTDAEYEKFIGISQGSKRLSRN